MPVQSVSRRTVAIALAGGALHASLASVDALAPTHDDPGATAGTPAPAERTLLAPLSVGAHLLSWEVVAIEPVEMGGRSRPAPRRGRRHLRHRDPGARSLADRPATSRADRALRSVREQRRRRPLADGRGAGPRRDGARADHRPQRGARLDRGLHDARGAHRGAPGRPPRARGRLGARRPARSSREDGPGAPGPQRRTARLCARPPTVDPERVMRVVALTFACNNACVFCAQGRLRASAQVDDGATAVREAAASLRGGETVALVGVSPRSTSASPRS